MPPGAPSYTDPNALPPNSTPVPPGVFNQTIASLADQPATHTGFSFDRNMLTFAQSLLEAQGMDAHRATVALTRGGVRHAYRYSQPAFYSPEGMTSAHSAISRGGLEAYGERQSDAGDYSSAKADGDGYVGCTSPGADIDHLTVLTRSARNMNVVQVSGDLRPLDLLHLGGHFGIPKVDPNAVMVPAP